MTGGIAYMAANSELKVLLAEQVTPSLAAEYTYDGRYLWFSPWRDHSRRVIRVYLLRGSAIFQWGRCFDFLPVLSNDNQRISYQRTDRSVGMQLFTWPEGHWSSAPAGSRPCRFSLFGRDRQEVVKGLLRAYGEAKPRWEAWFQETEGLEACLREAERQAAEAFNINSPHPAYVRPFLLAALGRSEEALAALEGFLAGTRGQDVPPAVGEKLRKKLRECVG